MSALQPVGVYALRIPSGDILVPAVPEMAPMFRITMAAIDPSAEPNLEDTEDTRPPRATLKMIRITDPQFDEDSDDEDYDEEDDEEDSDEENGGPSERKSKKLALLEALAAEEEDDEDDEDDSMEDEDGQIEAAEAIKQLLGKAKSKGKAKALDEDDEDDEDEEDEDSEEGVELEEVVICTLDPERHYNQPLDFTITEGERIFFKVTGTHEVHLTGNYVISPDDDQGLYDEDDEEDDYDLSPDEDELDALDALVDEDEESDELDDLADPRVTEVASDEEAPKLVAAAVKGKNKRPADDSDEDLDALVAKSIKKDEPVVNGESKKLSKAEKKAAKKLKKNDGEAAPGGTPDKKAETANGSEKKTVQFAKNLEQGPTPSAAPPVKKEEPKKEESKKTGASNATLGVRNVNGVTVDDRKLGSGPAAKKNSKVEMRYIGKLENGKVFDSNKSGKPLGFKLGTGAVIKGWDIGLEGISAGGERRITIPSHLAYGNKAVPGIPKNSKLIFDVKCLSVK